MNDTQVREQTNKRRQEIADKLTTYGSVPVKATGDNSSKATSDNSSTSSSASEASSSAVSEK